MAPPVERSLRKPMTHTDDGELALLLHVNAKFLKGRRITIRQEVLAGSVGLPRADPFFDGRCAGLGRTYSPIAVRRCDP